MEGCTEGRPRLAQVSGDPRRPAEAHKYERPKVNLEEQPPDMFLLMGLALGLLSLIFKVSYPRHPAVATFRACREWFCTRLAPSRLQCRHTCSPPHVLAARLRSPPNAHTSVALYTCFAMGPAPPCRPGCQRGARWRSACAAWPTPRAATQTSSSLSPPSPLRCSAWSRATCCQWGGDPMRRRQQRWQQAHSSWHISDEELWKLPCSSAEASRKRAIVSKSRLGGSARAAVDED